jgi:hypothetical protein
LLHWLGHWLERWLGGGFVIVLALTKNLFEDDNDYNDDDDAFVPPCLPCHRCRAASAFVWWLVAVLARSLAQALARGVIVIVLVLTQNLFDDNDNDNNNDDAFVSSLPLPPSLQKPLSLSTSE